MTIVSCTAVLSRVLRNARLATAGVGALWMLTASTNLSAQRSTIPVVTTIDSMRADGSVVSVPLRQPSPMFGLFAEDNFACVTYRSAGQLSGGAANLRGPVPFNQGGGCVPAHIYGNRTGYVFFEMGLAMATPPHEFRKIRDVHQGVTNMKGSYGYNANWQFVTSTPNRTVIAPADGQFGRNFSGVQIAFDGTCRDDRDFFQAGFAIMAMKDCPVTWGSEGYRGKLQVPDSVFRSLFAANAATFSWDEFRIPLSRLDQTRYLGAQSFYGYMSDYSRDIRARYGSVVPGGEGPPQESGYPLGIEMRVDGWQLSSVRLRHTQFYQVTMVNHSEKLYGAAIDYDSLYFGLTPGYLFGASRATSAYFDIARNSVHIARAGTSGKCSTTYPRRYAGQTAGCPGTGGANQTGGFYTMTWLKSPLGDNRNKQFTDPTSPYYAPTHVRRADTITYNHAMSGGFGNNAFSSGSMRRSFGAMAGHEMAFLDGQTPEELGISSYLYFFTPEDNITGFPTAANAKFNKFVPSTTVNPKTGQQFGHWDYNHDGTPDTISVSGCGRRGCHALWSDTSAGGFRLTAENVHNSVSAGPFPLKANDTTQFLWAFTWSPDTLEVDRRIGAVLAAYNSNWEGPAPIPFPMLDPATSHTVQSAEVRSSANTSWMTTASSARIEIRLPYISPRDEYLLREIARLREDSIHNIGRTRTLLRFNAGLLERLTTRAMDNLAEVYVFKSCDGGASWSNTRSTTADCAPAPTRNVGTGMLPFAWQPWGIVRYENGRPSTTSLTDDVKPSRTYLYSMVTRTRGFRDIAVIDSGTAGLFATSVEAAFGIPIDTISGPLATNGGSTISVYAPISEVAGSVFARVDTATLSGTATQGVQFSSVSATAEGTTRLVFANRFIVRKTVDTLTRATSTSVAAQYFLPAAVLSPEGPLVSGFVARAQTFVVDADVPVRSTSGLLAGTPRGTSGSSRVYVDTIAAPAGSAGYVWVTSGNRPIYVSNQLYTADADRYQRESPLYPGFSVRPRDSVNTQTGWRQELLPSGVNRDRHFVVRPAGDTVHPDVWKYGVHVQPISASAKRHRGGAYTMTWDTDPWGPGAPFRLDLPDELRTKVTASLEAAAASASTVTVTDAATATLVGATAARPLRRVRVPFVMTYKDAESGTTHPVTLAMLSRTIAPFDTRLLGTGNDTLRVQVPDSIWLPGDALFALHKVWRDSTVVVGGTRAVVLETETVNGITAYRPIRVVADSVGLDKFVVSCIPSKTMSSDRPLAFEISTCNPIVPGTRGATPNAAYRAVVRGQTESFELTHTFDARSEVALTALPFTTTTSLSKETLAQVNVVPNPYVVRSGMDDINGGSRIWFTGVPSRGTLRIYTLSGGFVQELNWTEGDLTYAGNVTTSGDLPFNLKTSSGHDLGSGLYMYVLTATGTQGRNQVHRGKFVIIR